MQSVLNPQGPDAAIIAEISRVLFAGGAIIFIAVMAIAVWAVLGRMIKVSENLLVVGGGIVFPLVTLSVLLVYSLVRAAALHPADPAPLRIEVVGEQWWWRVHYLDADGRRDFATANEIRVPVGRAVELHLKSADVIHSFWVPVLGGKLDMIPGRTNVLRVRADRAGEFRGQCAEYCGGPHAAMALYVVAEEPEQFRRWVANQRKPSTGSNPLFTSHCGACHTVRGTAAAGTSGPDLTHVGGRLFIGAGLLSNNAGALVGWIASSQHLKPGNLMPSFEHFTAEELRGLAAYLEGLK